jgi:hypothetical protein
MHRRLVYMEQGKTSWPIVVGVTAGIVGGIIAGVYLYHLRSDDGTETKLRDAKEIIAQCHEKIREIEGTLGALKQPAKRA